jgi:hypothetical protein
LKVVCQNRVHKVKWLTEPSCSEGSLMLSEVDEHVKGVVRLSDGSAFENPEGPPAKMCVDTSLSVTVALHAMFRLNELSFRYLTAVSAICLLFYLPPGTWWSWTI